MITGMPVDYILLRQRKRLANTVIHEGGNITDFAAVAGISAPAASKYLLARCPDLHARLKDNSRYAAHHPLTVLNRLRVISATKKRKDAAKKLQLSSQGLCSFLRDYAPEGVDAALREYEDAYGVPLFEDAA